MLVLGRRSARKSEEIIKIETGLVIAACYGHVESNLSITLMLPICSLV